MKGMDGAEISASPLAPKWRRTPVRPGTIQEMVETDARSRIRLLLHPACQKQDIREKGYNKRRMKGLATSAAKDPWNLCSRAGFGRPTDGTNSCGGIWRNPTAIF